MAPVGIQDVKITPAEAPQAAAAEGQRLTLDPARPQRGGISGGWWPRSLDAGAELPAMLTELSPLAGRVSRVAVQVDAFGNIPISSWSVAARYTSPGSGRWTPTRSA